MRRTLGGSPTSHGVPDVSFVISGDDRLATATWSAEVVDRRHAFVLCPGWGIEMEVSLRLCASLARRLAATGGAGTVLHWPGQGESPGVPADVSGLVGAAASAIDAARDRYPSWRWGLIGVRLGAWVALQAAARTGATPVLALEPVTGPVEHFADNAVRARRASLGRGDPEWAFGYPFPSRVDHIDEDTLPATAVIRYREGAAGTDAHQLVRGRWRADVGVSHARLERAAASWLDRLERVERRAS